MTQQETQAAINERRAFAEFLRKTETNDGDAELVTAHTSSVAHRDWQGLDRNAKQ